MHWILIRMLVGGGLVRPAGAALDHIAFADRASCVIAGSKADAALDMSARAADGQTFARLAWVCVGETAADQGP